MLCSAAAAVAAFSVLTVAAPAQAGDWLRDREAAGSIKDAPVEAKRRCDFSINIGGTSDYVFRGITQTFEEPAVQGGADVTCGLFYAGVWGSTVDFGDDILGRSLAPYEVDFYAGIKPTLGPVTFDLGVIYYMYPGARDNNAFTGVPEFNYVELKAGVSGSIQKLSLGGTLFWSPDYFAETGNTITLEGSAGYELPAIGIVTPTISGLIGTTQFLDTAFTNGDYVYWNAGIALAVDKFTFDFRYWDSNGGPGDFCGVEDLCDERFVLTAKVALP
ncbi:MAG: TorF family putative porin [Hyphomicrobiaceae bacterium]|nr:TorF family putative porin [Hyphomicrobiaceae bacterium]